MKIERQLQGTLNTVFTEVIRELNLEDRIEPYTVQEDGRADITLKRKGGKAIFFIELKDPTAKDGKSVFDSSVLLREVARAQKLDIRYFGNCNFLACAFFDSDKIYERAAVTEGFFTQSEIARLGVNYSPSKDILSKLKSIATFYVERAIEILDKKPITFSPLDELFIFKINKLIQAYGISITEQVWERYKSNKDFKKKIQNYTQSQLWNIPQTYEEIENLTHISLLMLISKLIFYKAYVDNQLYHRLHPMKIPSEINTPAKLENHIWQYFTEFKEITGNFELLIGERSDIIFQIPFVCESVIELIKETLETEGHYDFSAIPFDIIGRIFEELIREDERHKLGQYFTPPHVIDLINSFAIQHYDDFVLDPSCGSGTFLVRAYEKKRELSKANKKETQHEVLLDQIYGNDLSGYPAYLSMLNLAIRNTRKASYPRIVNRDFFSITANTKLELHNQSGKKERNFLPKFDAIVGNPPYTRQEDIGAMNGTFKKEQIMNIVMSECGFEPSQRTSIYGYFFYHASVFLKERGYLAFIVQNSWLDTDYGIDMQKYFLRNYEIVAILDSEVERFFPSASVNTSIVILRKQSDEDLRNENVVRFVYFKQSLYKIIEEYGSTDELKDIILNENKINENEQYKINCLQQSKLNQFTKWTQFLKAPKVYFDIIEKGFSKLVPLKTFVDVKFGIKTGADNFFIVKELSQKTDEPKLKAALNSNSGISSFKEMKKEKLKLVENGFNEIWLVEERYIEKCLASSKDSKTYELDIKNLPHSVLLINDQYKNIRNDAPFLYEYLKHGVKEGINQVPSCASRNLWYSFIQKAPPEIAFNSIISDFGKSYLGNVYPKADGLKSIYVKQKKHILPIYYFLNSTLSWLFQQFIIRTNFGDGAGDIKVYELEDMPVMVDFEVDNELVLGETRNFKFELGETNNINDVSKSRVKLDSAILKAIGYTNKKERDEVLLDLYKQTAQLISARLQKAQSMKSIKTQRNKIEFSVYLDQLKLMLQEGKHQAKATIKFVREIEKLTIEITSDTKLQKKMVETYWKEKFGESLNEKSIAKKTQTSLF
ncbi:MAG: N-6 DNA methylase [Bacteroidia bacterium]|nr:N-6 DNA methylase [Bacteroidia bacterium]